MARLLNGSTDKIDAGNSSTLSPAAASIHCWVNFTALTNAYSCIGGSRQAAGSSTGLFVKSTGKLAVYLSNSSSVTIDYDGAGSNTLVTGTWYAVGFSYDSSAGLIGYVNGGVDSTVAANGTLRTVIDDFSIGWDETVAGRGVAGSLADFGLWSLSLSAGEFAALAKGARPSKVRRQSLVGYWPLDGLQSPEPDLSGGKNNGTLTGTALAAGPPIALSTPRWPIVAPSSGSTIKYRRTFSETGTRAGSRQIQESP